MLFFSSENAVDRWCARKNLPRGALFSVDQLWALAKVWYGNRLSPDYPGRTLEEAQEIFRRLGFTAPFWYLD